LRVVCLRGAAVNIIIGHIMVQDGHARTSNSLVEAIRQISAPFGEIMAIHARQIFAEDRARQRNLSFTRRGWLTALGEEGSCLVNPSKAWLSMLNISEALFIQMLVKRKESSKTISVVPSDRL